ncbi:MAG TPA: D-arabinono-1,4-lactone oxidase [Polyangiaceae bacterium]|nr:D-arabinono-1,4-lactone oxidase [Polyangiaceae bacterium]
MKNPCAAPWINWSGTQEVYARRVERPTTLAGLQELVRDVSARRGRLKAVATGLSFSDILQTEDTLVETTGLLGEPDTGALLPLEQELWHVPAHRTPLVRVACGARIRALNAALQQAGLAFTNLGGYDGQTLVGALSTSTHGSGLSLPPLSDAVRSFDLVTASGELLRLEPSRGLTDPTKFSHRYGNTRTLVQSDAWFWPAVVGLGCLGVVHSAVVAVSPAYRLHERRRVRAWSSVESELRAGGVLRQFRNYEILINPYVRHDGDYSCLVTERNIAAPDARRVPLPPERRSAESTTFLATSQTGVLELMNAEPRMIPGMLEAGLGALETGPEDHVDESFLVYNVGRINTAHVVAGEYFFPLKDRTYLCAVRELLALVEKNRRRGIHQPTPFALRFVAGSRAPLSMARDEPHLTIELSLFRGSPRAAEALLSYERLCLALGGRPHWGQMHELTGEPGWLRRAYPRLDAFLTVFQNFNQSGVFNNHFTDRLGLSLPSGRLP